MTSRWWKPISAIVKYGLAGVFVVFGISAYWLYEHPMVGCDTFKDNLYTDQTGRSVISVREICSGIANSDNVSIDLYLPPKHRSTIFRFGTAYSFVTNSEEADLKITWLDPKTLKISVGKVAFVKSKVDRVGDIHIQYEIGSVVFNKN